MKPTFTPTPSEAAAIAEALDAMANTNGNGATMTAAELIDLLKSHPKACGVLGLRPNCEFVDTIRWCESFPRITPDCPMDDVEFACLWVLGAAQSKADELSVAVWFEDSPSGDGYVCGKYDADDELILYKTRLHALVEGIEAVA